MGERLLTPGDVAKIFGVDRKTVIRWVKTGRLQAVLTPGGHHRFRQAAVVDAQLNQRQETPS